MKTAKELIDAWVAQERGWSIDDEFPEWVPPRKGRDTELELRLREAVDKCKNERVRFDGRIDFIRVVRRCFCCRGDIDVDCPCMQQYRACTEEEQSEIDAWTLNDCEGPPPECWARRLSLYLYW